MRNRLTNKSIQHYYDSVLSGLITMDEFWELSMILPTNDIAIKYYNDLLS